MDIEEWGLNSNSVHSDGVHTRNGERQGQRDTARLDTTRRGGRARQEKVRGSASSTVDVSSL